MLRDGTNPNAGPAVMLGGPPAVAVLAAATAAAQTVARAAAAIHLELMLTPFEVDDRTAGADHA